MQSDSHWNFSDPVRDILPVSSAEDILMPRGWGKQDRALVDFSCRSLYYGGIIPRGRSSILGGRPFPGRGAGGIFRNRQTERSGTTPGVSRKHTSFLRFVVPENDKAIPP